MISLRSSIKVVARDFKEKYLHADSSKQRKVPKRKELGLYQFVQSEAFYKIVYELVHHLRKDEPMKNEHEIKRTQQHICGHSFYGFAKDSIGHNIEDHPNVNYLLDCNK